MLSLSGTGDADEILRLNLITVCQPAWDENDRTVITKGTPAELEIHTTAVAVFSSKIPNSKFFFRHLHEDLNLDEIKNALRLLSVNGETNLMN